MDKTIQTIRVKNIRKYPIGIRLQNGRELAIRPGGFVQLDREDIEWVASTAPALFMGARELQQDDREAAVEMGFIQKVDDRPLDEEEVRQHLSLSATKLHQWLQGIHEPYLLDAIYEVAVTMELSSSKLKILQEKMPDREFLPVVDESQGG